MNSLINDVSCVSLGNEPFITQEYQYLSKTISGVLYNPNLIKHVALKPEEYLKVPISSISDDSCAVLTLDKIDFNDTQPQNKTRICPGGIITSIILHGLPIAGYILQVNGFNVLTAKNNVFDFTAPNPGSIRERLMEEFAKEKIPKYLNCDRIDMMAIINPKIVQNNMPDKFSYTVTRADGSEQVYTAYHHKGITLPLYGHVSFIDIYSRDTIITHNDEVIFKYSGLDNDSKCIRIYFNDILKKYHGLETLHLSPEMIENSLNFSKINHMRIITEAKKIHQWYYRPFNYPSFSNIFNYEVDDF